MSESGRVSVNMGEFVQVQLRRMETSQSWGFRLRGGTDQGIPLHVEQVGACVHDIHATLVVI